MAKKQLKTKSIEETLWESANKLRGSVEPSEYKHVVLSLIFLKYANDRFEERRNELIADGKAAFIDQAVFYNAKNVFYIEEQSRWSFIMENAKQNDIAIKIDKALSAIEDSNPTLKGALPSNYYSGLGLDRAKLAALLDEINKIDTLKDPENDLIGRVYEYFLAKFAIAEGKGKGEYYTPKSIVNLIAENHRTISRQDLRPLLRFGRYVRAKHEVHRSSSRKQTRHLCLWSGIYQYHIQAGEDEPRHSWHRQQPRRIGS